MAKRLSLVSVKTGLELSWAELDGDEITYSPTDMGVFEGVIRNRMREHNENPKQAFAGVARDGWSNAYLMVAGVKGTT